MLMRLERILSKTDLIILLNFLKVKKTLIEFKYICYNKISIIILADIILSLIPQLVIIPHIMDNYGCPICIEQYNFVPSEILKQITISEYVTFVIYSLEFKSLVLDQLSHQREQNVSINIII